jgi:hypothetical protein
VPFNARYIASLTATACLGLTLVLQVAPQLDPTIGNRRFHVGLETAAAMVLVFVAAVLLGRFRLNGSRRTLFKLVAVTLLALDNLYSAVLTVVVDSVSSGGFATWTFMADGVIGALLLAGAAVLPDRRVRQRGRALLIAAGALLAILIGIILPTALLGDRLPGVFETPPTTVEELRLFSEHASVIVMSGITAICYAVAAVGFARLAEEEEDEFLQWLSIGSVIAATAFINYTLFPSQFT